MQITLKDIARKCNVSATLVSAVLNDRRGKIRYTDETRDLIVETARKMGYRPNILARSMVSRRSPVIGVMLCANSMGYSNGNFDYFNIVFPALTELLNSRGFEVLFVPFRDEEEQLERLARLTGAGLIGGIITNIISNSYSKIVPELQKLSMPYVILGNPSGFDCSCVYTAFDFSWSSSFMRHRGLKNAVLVTVLDDDILCYQLPFRDGCFWTSKPLTMEKFDWNDRETLYLCTDIHVLHTMPQLPDNLILISREHQFVPPGIPTAICRPGYHARLKYTAEVLARWLNTGEAPSPQRVCLPPEAVDEFINFSDEELPDSYVEYAYRKKEDA